MYICEEELNDKVVIFLDCEGLGSTGRDKAYDTKLMAMALLMSSVFIYNSKVSVCGWYVVMRPLRVAWTRRRSTVYRLYASTLRSSLGSSILSSVERHRRASCLRPSCGS